MTLYIQIQNTVRHCLVSAINKIWPYSSKYNVAYYKLIFARSCKIQAPTQHCKLVGFSCYMQHFNTDMIQDISAVYQGS